MTIRRQIDQRNIQLSKLIYQLKQDLELYRVIGLNTAQLKEHGGSNNFWAHIQHLAQQSIGLTVCKIYESKKRNDLNSIPGIIGALDSTLPTPAQREVEKFGRKFLGEKFPGHEPNLKNIFDVFCSTNKSSLDALKTFRDKIGAHSEHIFSMESLPSIESFESLLGFAESFYCVVSESILGIGPARFDSHIGKGALRVMRKLGIEDPTFDFDEPET
jgi:hypothetical protein